MIFANSFATFAANICRVSREAPLRFLSPILLLLCFPFLSLAQTDSRIPAEVLHRSGYVNAIPKPADFTSAMLWGIAIADTRVAGSEKAQVEISHTQLSCRIDGKDVVLNDDHGAVRGGLYSRSPWFGTDAHDPMPMAIPDSPTSHKGVEKGGTPARSSTRGVVLRVGKGALLQVGFDYWRNPTVGYESGGNNHEAGASAWYFPSEKWQETTFTDVHH